MRGDRLVIEQWHRKAGKQAAEGVLPLIRANGPRFAITVAGESGSGKSEIASVLADALSEQGVSSIILQQDDYFILPPKSNENKRRAELDWVGANEVRLDLMDRNLRDFRAGDERLTKPLVIFEEDRIDEEIIDTEGRPVIIAEGTFTTTLNHADCRIFIDKTFHETKKARLIRAREAQDDFLENVLKIEHKIISSHKRMADFLVVGEYDVIPNPEKVS